MVEQLFLCGLSPAQRAQHEGGRELRLHGRRPNLRLELDDLRRGLLDAEPVLLADFIEIATYVFAADNLVRRGGVTLKHMGERWRRSFRLVIAVRRPGTWEEPQLLHALCEALRFLSDDSWSFEFVELENPPLIQRYLSYADNEVERAGGAPIVLFSGGLDSFAGAVQELNASNGHVVLLSRRIVGITDGRQRELADTLSRRHRRRITHVRVDAGLTDETQAREHTQRTRTFLLTAIALVAAAIERTDRICFYENGIMSVNLPISTQVVGARASRSTHPRSLLLLEELCRLVWRDAIAIDNPFIWKTKAEVVAELFRRPEREAIAYTISCSRTRQINRYKTHCGTCAQCLQCRISTLGASAADADPGESYVVDLLLDPRQAGQDRAMAVDTVRSALELVRLSDADFATRFSAELAWLTTSFPGQAPEKVAHTFIAMFRRHGETVRRILVEAATHHAGELIDHKFPPSCLLQLAVNSPDVELDLETIVIRRPEIFDEAAATEEIVEGGEILLAVDDVNKRILIDGIALLTAPAEFRLMSVLIERHREDRDAERAPDSYRTMSAADLAEAASTVGDVAGRKAIHRLRDKINRGYQELYGTELHPDAVVQTVGRKGYRLNPAVRIVALDQLRRR